MKKGIRSLIITAAVSVLLASQAIAGSTHRIAWSHYTGWEPWAYIQESGIMDKWAKKYGLDKVEIVLVNDYVESINLYTSGQFDGCVMTNMDALTIPAVGGVDSTALIVGDFSNGNDGVVLMNGSSVKDLAGRKMRIVQLSVSHYLLTRALDMNGMKEKDLTLINTSDADIASIFASEVEKDPKAAVTTWNPLLMQVRNVKGANLVFDSSQIPGEIIDCLVVKSSAPEALKKALTGAWYEAMAKMNSPAGSKEALEVMAKSAGGTLAEFKAQLKTTKMFYAPAEAAAFAAGEQVKKTMDYVRSFSFEHGLYGEGAPSKELVGIAFPDGAVLGDKANVKLRFDKTYMQMAADGKL
ncbi:MAG: NitT/TauT family transport system substrate-binding protein [Candidatus Electronema aureum]|uniref:NitT/TauT family transport system substrate-binding protein n=1 Tax=Candidatus Electronema aureum TaxID=2005002 RepID=A0A521G112_9BACT|nr:MAG: NitT/TauT family transport system substrate-binding protein [Candidatus Electronema aureum]